MTRFNRIVCGVMMAGATLLAQAQSEQGMQGNSTPPQNK